MFKPGVLVVRADAGASIGRGHVMRCLALGQMWQDRGGECIFVFALEPGSLREKLEAQGMRVCLIDGAVGSTEDMEQTIAVARDYGAEWVVLDGYNFSSANQKQIKDAGLRLLCLDDNADYEHYFADIILNQNIHADESMYPRKSCEEYSRLFLGTEFSLLRREFLKNRSAAAERRVPVRRVMVTMGGGDPDNITGKVLSALGGFEDLQLKVIVGGSNQNYSQLREQVDSLACECEIIYDADDRQMCEAMLWADFAISAAGSTVWELLLMKLPGVVMALAENQEGIARELERRGLFAVYAAPVFDCDGFAELVRREISAFEAGGRALESEAFEFRTDELLRAMIFGDIGVVETAAGN